MLLHSFLRPAQEGAVLLASPRYAPAKLPPRSQKASPLDLQQLLRGKTGNLPIGTCY